MTLATKLKAKTLVRNVIVRMAFAPRWIAKAVCRHSLFYVPIMLLDGIIAFRFDLAIADASIMGLNNGPRMLKAEAPFCDRHISEI
jgi:uncharacterized membrane protein